MEWVYIAVALLVLVAATWSLVAMASASAGRQQSPNPLSPSSPKCVLMVVNDEQEAGRAIYDVFDRAERPENVHVYCAVVTDREIGCRERVQDKVSSLSVAGNLGNSLLRERIEETRVAIAPVTQGRFRGSLVTLCLLAQMVEAEEDAVVVCHESMNGQGMVAGWDNKVTSSRVLTTSASSRPTFLCWNKQGKPQLREMQGRAREVPSLGVHAAAFCGDASLIPLLVSLGTTLQSSPVASDAVLSGWFKAKGVAAYCSKDPWVTSRGTIVASPNSVLLSLAKSNKQAQAAILHGATEADTFREILASSFGPEAAMGLTEGASDAEILSKWGSGAKYRETASFVRHS